MFPIEKRTLTNNALSNVFMLACKPVIQHNVQQSQSVYQILQAYYTDPYKTHNIYWLKHSARDPHKLKFILLMLSWKPSKQSVNTPAPLALDQGRVCSGMIDDVLVWLVMFWYDWRVSSVYWPPFTIGEVCSWKGSSAMAAEVKGNVATRVTICWR